jgi:hypothetical protein
MYTLLSHTFEKNNTLYSTIENVLEYDLTKNISNPPRNIYKCENKSSNSLSFNNIYDSLPLLHKGL